MTWASSVAPRPLTPKCRLPGSLGFPEPGGAVGNSGEVRLKCLGSRSLQYSAGSPIIPPRTFCCQELGSPRQPPSHPLTRSSHCRSQPRAFPPLETRHSVACLTRAAAASSNHPETILADSATTRRGNRAWWRVSFPAARRHRCTWDSARLQVAGDLVMGSLRGNWFRTNGGGEGVALRGITPEVAR